VGSRVAEKDESEVVLCRRGVRVFGVVREAEIMLPTNPVLAETSRLGMMYVLGRERSGASARNPHVKLGGAMTQKLENMYICRYSTPVVLDPHMICAVQNRVWEIPSI